MRYFVSSTNQYWYWTQISADLKLKVWIESNEKSIFKFTYLLIMLSRTTNSKLKFFWIILSILTIQTETSRRNSEWAENSLSVDWPIGLRILFEVLFLKTKSMLFRDKRKCFFYYYWQLLCVVSLLKLKLCVV